MKIIVACQKCSRRYNAAGRASGTRFHCHCGETLTVAAPRGHDAAVVRCSSCGAPREQGTDNCEHCHSEFTLFERDLHSVCPVCLARVSDRARYCHHCAAPLVVDNLTVDKTDWKCPACPSKRKLISRRFGDMPFAVLECTSCAGLWLGLESLEEMVASESRNLRSRAPGTNSHQGATAAKRPRPVRGYIPCIVCSDLMSRRNLASGKSGIVVDICGRHGVWFDADELSLLVNWMRGGGLEDVRLDLARLAGSKDDIGKRQVLARQSGPVRTKTASRPVNRSRPLIKSYDNWLEVLAQIAAEVLRRRKF